MGARRARARRPRMHGPGSGRPAGSPLARRRRVAPRARAGRARHAAARLHWRPARRRGQATRRRGRLARRSSPGRAWARCQVPLGRPARRSSPGWVQAKCPASPTPAGCQRKARPHAAPGQGAIARLREGLVYQLRGCRAPRTRPAQSAAVGCAARRQARPRHPLRCPLRGGRPRRWRAIATGALQGARQGRQTHRRGHARRARRRFAAPGWRRGRGRARAGTPRTPP